MNNEGSAVYCSNCTYLKSEKAYSDQLHKFYYTGCKFKAYVMLGSVTPDGLLFMRLQHGGTACFNFGTIALSCLCGYTVEVTLRGSGHEPANPDYAQN